MEVWESLPLWLSLAVVLSCFVGSGKAIAYSGWVRVAFAVSGMVLSILALHQVLSQGGDTQIFTSHGRLWEPVLGVPFSLVLDPIRIFCLVLIWALYLGFELEQRLSNVPDGIRGLARSLGLLAGHLVILANPVPVFLFGWILLSLVLFLADLGISEPRDERLGAHELLLVKLMGDAITIVGFSGVFLRTGLLELSKWKDVAPQSVGVYPYLVVLGVLAKGFQLPTYFCLSSLAKAGARSFAVWLSGPMILLPFPILVVSPMLPQDIVVHLIRIALLLMASWMVLGLIAEEDDVAFQALFVSILQAIAMNHLLSGHPSQAVLGTVSSTFVMAILWMGVHSSVKDSFWAKLFFGVGLLSFFGLPGWGFSQSLWTLYGSNFEVTSDLSWIVWMGTVVSLFLHGGLVLASAVHLRRLIATKVQLKKEEPIPVPLSLLAVLGSWILVPFSITLGIGIFSGFFDGFEKEHWAGLLWFGEWFQKVYPQIAHQDESIVSNPEIVSQVLTGVVLAISLVLGFFLFFSSDQAGADRLKRWRGWIHKTGYDWSFGQRLIERLVKPLLAAVARGFLLFENALFGRRPLDSLAMVRGTLGGAFQWVQTFIIEGFANIVGKVFNKMGDGLVLAELGSVQFYLAVGLLFSIILIVFAKGGIL